MAPKVTTWTTVKWDSVLLRPGTDQRCAVMEVTYTVGDAGDPSAQRKERIELTRVHPLLAQMIAQTIGSTSPRLSVVDVLISLLLVDLQKQEGIA